MTSVRRALVAGPWSARAGATAWVSITTVLPGTDQLVLQADPLRTPTLGAGARAVVQDWSFGLWNWGRPGVRLPATASIPDARLIPNMCRVAT